MAYVHINVCIAIGLLNVGVLSVMGRLSWAWFPITFGIVSAIYLILIYIKRIINLAIENDTICILSRVMYENQQLKRQIVYLTNQMNQMNQPNVDSTWSQ